LAANPEQIGNLKEIQQEMQRLSRKRISNVVETELLALNAAFHRQVNHIPRGNRLRWFLRISNQFTQTEVRHVTPEWLKMSSTSTAASSPRWKRATSRRRAASWRRTSSRAPP